MAEFRGIMRTQWRIGRLLGAVVVWWALYGLMLASQLVNMGSFGGGDATWERSLVYAYGSIWAWAPMTCIAYLVARRFPIGKPRFWRSLLIHATVVAGFIVFKAVYAHLTNPFFAWYPTLPPFIEILDASVRNNLTLGWTVVGLAHGIVYYESTQDRERKLAQLERSLATAKLEALRARLNPHFLFNALNSVAELMQDDVEQADRMLVAISEMLRDGLRSHDAQERPLREELRHVGNYLTIEGIRLGTRMTSSLEVEEACMDIPVPVLSLQPLVENAIVHSIARSRAPGWVKVSCWIDESDLNLTVQNSTSTVGARKEGNGVGLRTVADRLSLLYGSRGRIQRIETGHDVYCVHLVVPLPGTMATSMLEN